MAVAKVIQAQRDFSGGEADVWTKRADDHPLLKTSARQAVNWRVLASRALANRPGRRIIGREHARTDEVIMSPGNNFFLVFGDNYLRVYNAAFAAVFDSGATLPWVSATVKNIVWDYYKLSIYICFTGMQPRVLTWDGVSQSSSWSLALYAETVASSGQKRTVFYRLSPPGETLRPSATTGAVNLPFSSGMNLVAGQVGTRLRFSNSQITINSVTNATNATGTVNQVLPWGSVFSVPTPTNFAQVFSVGDEIIGLTSGSKAIISSIAADGSTMAIQHLNLVSFIVGETIVSPSGSMSFGASTGVNPPVFSPVWDDEVMNAFRGWPASCFVDQGRLGFCDFPALPQLIVWSAVGNFTDLYTDANNAGPTNAIQELVPGKSRVLYVAPGADGSEFVFCDNAVYSIPINQNNPLKPGSVAFNTLVAEGSAQIQPRAVQQSIVYIGAGSQQLRAVQAIGAYNRPYIVDDISELRSHLLNAPITIAAPGGSDQFEESYFYLCNSDGTIVVVNYKIANGIIDPKTMGWLPWTGGGTATWISSLKGHSDVIVTGSYAPNGVTQSFVEQVDNTQYLDAAMLYNAAPASLAPPGGKGPLWFLAGATVDLMDGLRMMGTYAIDANGFLVPQNNAGENFLSATLSVGQAWTATLEPWVPAVQPGQDAQQRLRKRRIMRFEVYAQNSTGFTICRLFGGPVTRTSPATGTIMQRRRIAAWNQDDDPTLAPPLREQSYAAKPLGRLHDPRVAIIKDTPGPLTILEIDLEVTV